MGPASRALGRPFLHMLSRLEVDRYAAAVWQSGQVLEWPELPVAACPAGALAISYFILSFQPFFFQDKEMLGILLVAQDVTPLPPARQQVKQLQAKWAVTIAGLAGYVTELMQDATGHE